MNRFEMFLKLLENPKRTAINNEGNTAYFDGFLIRWKNTDNIVTTHYYVSETWQIIEPQKKLREMDFGEAMFEFYSNPELTYYNEIKSVLTGQSLERPYSDITKEEYMGKWTVEGIYEESEGE